MSELKCPACRCRTFAKVDEPTLDGGWDNSKLIRCVECKRTYAAPPRPDAPSAGECGGLLEKARDDVSAAHAIGRFLLEAAQARIEVLEACLRCDDESVRTAWAREAKWRDAGIDLAASLAAAISLLERSPKTAAPSNRMFDQMLADYRASLDRFRAALPAPPQADGGEG